MKYAFSRLQTDQFNNLLPNIDSAVTVMKFHAYQTGQTEELRKALEDFYKQINISIYGRSPLEGQEVEDTVVIIKKLQRIASLMALAVRPALMIKELLVGTLKNVSFA